MPRPSRSYCVSLAVGKHLAIQLDEDLDAEEIDFAIDWLRLAIKGLERQRDRLAKLSTDATERSAPHEQTLNPAAVPDHQSEETK